MTLIFNYSSPLIQLTILYRPVADEYFFNIIDGTEEAEITMRKRIKETFQIEVRLRIN